MSEKNIVLIDANVIIRFLIGDGGDLFGKSQKIFQEIDSGKYKAKILESVLAEIIYVLLKVYNVSKNDIVNSLLPILQMKYVIMDNKTFVIHAVEIFNLKNIDFVDALLCSYKILNNMDVISFDKDLKKC